VTLPAHHHLAQFHEGSWVPTSALVVEETFPNGRYDRLGDRPSNGLGAGAYTTLGFNPHTDLWLPNGRILRMRFDITQAFSRHVGVDGISVYGTVREQDSAGAQNPEAPTSSTPHGGRA